LRDAHVKATSESVLPDHFSFSAASTFQDCPKKWWYTYIKRLPREFNTSSLLFGASLHAALETIHFELYRDRHPKLETAIETYETNWRVEAKNNEVRFNKDETYDSLFNSARALVSDYFNQDFARLGSVLGVEQEIRLQLKGMTVPVVGRIDVLFEKADFIRVTDAKTTKAAFNEDKVHVSAAQLALYASSIEALSRQKQKPLAGRFVVFRKLKTPRIEVVDVPLTVADQNRALRMLKDTWSLIEVALSADAFPARRSWVCKQCPFLKRCDADSGAALS